MKAKITIDLKTAQKLASFGLLDDVAQLIENAYHQGADFMRGEVLEQIRAKERAIPNGFDRQGFHDILSDSLSDLEKNVRGMSTADGDFDE